MSRMKYTKNGRFFRAFITFGIFLFLFIAIVLRKTPLLYTSVSEGSLVKVIQVIDGDTIEIAGGEKIRYIGIDAPETVDPRKSAQCFGREASRKNKALVEGKMVRLEKDVTERDKYHRLLRYVWVGDTFINAELVRQGFAYSYLFPPNIKYHDIFIKSQQEAQDARRGLWSRCSY